MTFGKKAVSTLAGTFLVLLSAVPALPQEESEDGASNNFEQRHAVDRIPMGNLNGRVLLSTGVAPLEPVEIIRQCGGRAEPVAFTVSNGRFSFSWNAGPSMGFADASASNGAQGHLYGAETPSPSLQGWTPPITSMNGCELQARLDGFRASPMQLNGSVDTVGENIGIIVLKPLVAAEGDFVSLNSLKAPPKARTLYSKAFQELHKKKPNPKSALSSLDRALAAYPQFAAAWQLRGEMMLANENFPEARAAFEQSMTHDEKYIRPLSPLIRMAIAEERWRDAVSLSQTLLRLYAGSLDGLFYLAVSHQALGDLAAADQVAADLVKMDSENRMTQAQCLLGSIREDQYRFSDSAAHYAACLTAFPHAAFRQEVETKVAEWRRNGSIRADD